MSFRKGFSLIHKLLLSKGVEISEENAKIYLLYYIYKRYNEKTGLIHIKSFLKNLKSVEKSEKMSYNISICSKSGGCYEQVGKKINCITFSNNSNQR